MKNNQGIAHIIMIIIGLIVILVIFGFFSVKRGSGSNFIVSQTGK